MILQMFKIVCFPTFQYSHKIGNTYSDICKICRILFFMMRTSLQAINHLHASNLGKKVTLTYPFGQVSYLYVKGRWYSLYSWQAVYLI